MAKQTFAYHPDEGSSMTIKSSVNVVSFGDGYEQRTNHGINTSKEVWEVSFTRSLSEITPIVNFLKARNSTESFLWTTPDEVQITCVCRPNWKVNRIKVGISQVVATFEQVFEQ